MKAWIYEICNNHETDEKYIKFNLRHAFHKGYDVIGISRIQSSQAMKRTDSDNFQKISATIREAAAAGAEVIITSYFEGYCKSAYEEMRKKLLCDELGMKFETSVSEVKVFFKEIYTLAKPLPAHTYFTVRIPYPFCSTTEGEWKEITKIINKELVYKDIPVEIWMTEVSEKC